MLQVQPLLSLTTSNVLLVRFFSFLFFFCEAYQVYTVYTVFDNILHTYFTRGCDILFPCQTSNWNMFTLWVDRSLTPPDQLTGHADFLKASKFPRTLENPFATSKDCWLAKLAEQLLNSLWTGSKLTRWRSGTSVLKFVRGVVKKEYERVPAIGFTTECMIEAW